MVLYRQNYTQRQTSPSMTVSEVSKSLCQAKESNTKGTDRIDGKEFACLHLLLLILLPTHITSSLEEKEKIQKIQGH